MDQVFEGTKDKDIKDKIRHNEAEKEEEEEEEDNDASLDFKNDARLVRRVGPYFQSGIAMGVSFQWDNTTNFTRLTWIRLIARDMFHYVISLPGPVLFFLVTLGYTAQALVFGGIYVLLSNKCEDFPAPISFQTAFAFSMETSTTVGYTLIADNDKMFFGGCLGWTIVIYLQMVFTMILNAVVVGLLLVRITRADRRALGVMFSRHACIVSIFGKHYLIFQVIDLDGASPLVNPTVSLMSVFHESKNSVTAHFQARVMRLLHPDDQVSSSLFLSTPSTIIHPIDPFSPLMPRELIRKIPAFKKSKKGINYHPGSVPMFPGLVERESEGYTGDRIVTICPGCGDTFVTHPLLERHIEYMKAFENEGGDHFKIDPVDCIAMSKYLDPASATEGIKKHIERTKLEVICLIEAIDPRTGASFQSRQSYCADDILCNRLFSPCTLNENGHLKVDLSQFHNTFEVGTNLTENIPPMASHS